MLTVEKYNPFEKIKMKTQNELKQEVAQAAAKWALDFCPPNTVLGVGTGSTMNAFIDALAQHKKHFTATVASSKATEERLKKHGFTVLDLNAVDNIWLYVDGADEINPYFQLIKGGGGALTREKIVAAASNHFLCIADESKWVQNLGNFPLPFEVLAFAENFVTQELKQLGANVKRRVDFITDNGNIILDVKGLNLNQALISEIEFNQIPGVVTCGLFARRTADFVLLSSQNNIIQHQKKPQSSK